MSTTECNQLSVFVVLFLPKSKSKSGLLGSIVTRFSLSFPQLPKHALLVKTRFTCKKPFLVISFFPWFMFLHKVSESNCFYSKIVGKNFAKPCIALRNDINSFVLCGDFNFKTFSPFAFSVFIYLRSQLFCLFQKEL